MAKASAWLALVYGALQAVWLIVFNITSEWTPAILFVFGFQAFGILFLGAGAAVVLFRRRPGLRLLASAWAFVLSATISPLQFSYIISADFQSSYTDYDLVVISPGGVVASTLVSITGLLFTLLARRPNHS